MAAQESSDLASLAAKSTKLKQSIPLLSEKVNTESEKNIDQTQYNNQTDDNKKRSVRTRSTKKSPKKEISKPIQSDDANNLKVEVSGYPSYTQPQDIAKQLSKFGKCKVDMNKRIAIATFSTELEAKAAVKESKNIYTYGKFLTITHFGGKAHINNTRQSNNPKPNNFTRSKQKSAVIINPKELDFSGDFYQQLDGLMAAVRLSQEEVQTLGQLYTDLEKALQDLWPNCVAVPFGSITTGLGIKTSDADCFVNVPMMFDNQRQNFISKAKRQLQKIPHIFAEILAIPRANTPIIKFFHIPTKNNCDVNFKTPLGVQNSSLIAYLLHIDARIIPIAVAIKYWAKTHDLTGTGKLTNYALTMMIIYYLQLAPISIIPSVESLQRNAANDIIVDYWNTGFSSKKEDLLTNSFISSIPNLLGGFFKYYATFDFDKQVVCPFLGTMITKKSFQDLDSLPPQFNRYKYNVVYKLTYPLRVNCPMCIQDPFELCHNVASGLSEKMSSDIVEFFKFAANIFENQSTNDYKGFLETLLLQKPEIINTKNYNVIRYLLPLKLTKNIEDPDWQSVVRDVILSIFEKILKIKLVKLDDKENIENEDSKSDSESTTDKQLETDKESGTCYEQYVGTLTKAVWKRHQSPKMMNQTNEELIKKESEITDKTILADPDTIEMKINLTLTFLNKRNRAVINMVLGEYNVNVRKKFENMFYRDIVRWCYKLLNNKCTNRVDDVNKDEQKNDKRIVTNVDRDVNKIDSESDDNEIVDRLRIESLTIHRTEDQVVNTDSSHSE